MNHSNLVADAFAVLRRSFFDEQARPIPFDLRPKRNTQDDPLDEYIAQLLKQGLPDALCRRASGPLINPDMVLYRPALCSGAARSDLADDTTRIVALEVKKLERTAGGKVARATGLDYNTTPPCGMVRLYAADDSPLDVRGFYLFVAQEKTDDNRFVITALVLCDGNALNQDFALYLSAVGQREKEIDLGTYGNGVDRRRPMFIFANPLGAPEFDRQATLIVDDLADERLRPVYRIVRTTADGNRRRFHAYCLAADVPADWQVQTLQDPFPRPNTRVARTQRRGRFRLPIEVL